MYLVHSLYARISYNKRLVCYLKKFQVYREKSMK